MEYRIPTYFKRLPASRIEELRFCLTVLFHTAVIIKMITAQIGKHRRIKINRWEGTHGPQLTDPTGGEGSAQNPKTPLSTRNLGNSVLRHLGSGPQFGKSCSEVNPKIYYRFGGALIC